MTACFFYIPDLLIYNNNSLRTLIRRNVFKKNLFVYMGVEGSDHGKNHNPFTQLLNCFSTIFATLKPTWTIKENIYIYRHTSLNLDQTFQLFLNVIWTVFNQYNTSVLYNHAPMVHVYHIHVVCIKLVYSCVEGGISLIVNTGQWWLWPLAT